MRNKSVSSLNQLKGIFSTQIQKKTTFLDKKNKIIHAKLDEKVAGIKKMEKEIKALKQVFADLDVVSFEEMKRQKDSKEEMYNKLQQQKKNQEILLGRMEKLLLVCEINAQKNEEWVRDLNKYDRNLVKGIRHIKQNNLKQVNIMRDLENDELKLRDMYNVRKSEHEDLLSEFKEELKRKEHLDSIIAVTDELIQKSVQVRATDIDNELNEELGKAQQEG